MLKNITILAIVIVLTLANVVSIAYSINLVNESYRSIPDGLPWYFLVVFGDNRPSDTHSVELPSVYYRIVGEVRVLAPFAVIGTGDHTGRGTREQINEFINSLKGLENVWVCLGNHDLYSSELDYWVRNVAPEFYYVDDIPGWRIVFVNTNAEPLGKFINETHILFQGAGGRRIILVIHYPLYPDVKHNIVELDDGVERMKVLLQLINEYNVSLVLQGHWHGYAETTVNNTKYIITGGGGAPLYWSPMNIDAERVAKGKYHYLILTLFPNGTYTYTPVDARIGEIKIIRINETTYLIKNTKVDLWGNPIEMPVRLNITVNKQLHYIVLMAKPNTTTLVSYIWNNNTPILTTNTDKFYIYIPTNDPEKPIVYTIENTTLIKIQEIPEELKQQLEKNKTTTTTTSSTKTRPTTPVYNTIQSTNTITKTTKYITSLQPLTSSNTIISKASIVSRFHTTSTESTTKSTNENYRLNISIEIMVIIVLIIILYIIIKRVINY